MSLKLSLEIWARRGCRMLPLNDGSESLLHPSREGESSRLKAPLCPDWRNRATRFLPLLRSWSKKTSAFGLLTGEKFEGGYLYVVDCDISAGVDGVSRFLRMARSMGHGNIEETFSVTTPSGGRHFWFVSDRPLKNTGGKLGMGIDTRGLGGYVGMPGSGLFLDGKFCEYAVLRHFADVLPLPSWIEEAVSRPGRAPEKEFFTGGLEMLPEPTPLAYRTIMECLSRICNAPEGQRNSVLYTQSQRLARFSPRYISIGGMIENCVENGCLTGLHRREVVDTVHSAFHSGVASMKVFFSDDPDYEKFTGIRPFSRQNENEEMKIETGL